MHRSGYAQSLPPAHGFTLIELLLSIAIMGVLAAIGIPQLFGIYNNQAVINTANEMVTALRLAQNKALANDQMNFSPSPTPLPDCTASTNYIDHYGVKFYSSSQYRVYYYLRDKSLDGSTNCSSTPSARTADIAQYNIFGSTYIASGVGEAVTYDTTSGKPELTTGLANKSNPIIIKSTKSPITYYICVDNAGKAYAQSTACP